MSSLATSASVGTKSRVQNLLVRDDLKMLGASNAIVYRGTATIDGTPDVPVAVKVFPPVAQIEPEKIMKEYNSQQQALAIAAGQVCQAYGIVHDEKHKMCLVMKLYDGTIADELKKTPNAPLPLDRALLVGLTVAQAICALHSSDEPRTYQDLKPENIFVDTAAGTVVLGDFGTTRTLRDSVGTVPSQMRGTFNYMSPEQAFAKDFYDKTKQSTVTPKSDSWTFGTTMIHLLSGKIPWQPGIMFPPPPLYNREAPEYSLPEGTPSALAQLVESCLKPNPDDRPGFDMIVERLEEIMPETLPSSAPVPGPSPAPTPAAVPGPPPPNRDLKIALLDFEEELEIYEKLYEKESRAEAVAQNNKIRRQEADLSRLKEQQDKQERQSAEQKEARVRERNAAFNRGDFSAAGEKNDSVDKITREIEALRVSNRENMERATNAYNAERLLWEAPMELFKKLTERISDGNAKIEKLKEKRINKKTIQEAGKIIQEARKASETLKTLLAMKERIGNVERVKLATEAAAAKVKAEEEAAAKVKAAEEAAKVKAAKAAAAKVKAAEEAKRKPARSWRGITPAASTSTTLWPRRGTAPTRTLPKVDWNAVERVVGKKAADQMKQGAGFTGTLDLYEKWITDEGCRTIAPALRTMPNLEELYLSRNNIGDEGCRTIAPALRTMPNLKVLYLHYNNIGDEGLAAVLSNVVSAIPLLYELALNGNKIGNVGCQCLLELIENDSLQSLTGLNLSGNHNISSELKTKFRRVWSEKGKGSRLWI